MSECCLNTVEDNEMGVLMAQLRKELMMLKTDTTAKLLIQDGKIAETCVYIMNNLSNYIREMFATMEATGELADIITSVVLADIVSDIDKTNVYFDGITTEKIFDEISSTYYYLTKIPKKDKNGKPIHLKMGIANDDKSCTTLESTLKHAWRKNATVCVNCGVWDIETNTPIASVIYEGEIIYRDMPTVTPEKYQYFAITYNNEIKTYPIGTTPEAMIDDGVYYACPIFATLLRGGTPVIQTDLRKEPRQSIGVTATGEINIISCDGRNYESEGMSYDDLARIHALNGSINAYIFDGGGSTSTVVRGVKQNENIDNFTTDRSVGTFIYIAKDTNVSPDNNVANHLGRVKQFLIGQIRSKVDFPMGRIALRAPEGQRYPTIQMFANGEEDLRCRFTFSYDPENQRNNYAYIGLMGPEDTSMKTNLFRIFPHGVWVQTYHGSSSSRPNGVVGLCYFDESIGKPIWYDGSKWVDSTGTAV